MKNKLIGIIICTLLIGTVLPVSGTLIIDKTTPSNMSGNTLYVGGSGAGNYTFIQDAINDSVDGDTVFVYDDSTPYIEKLTIDKELTLLGEDKETTIIDSLNLSNYVISISANEVTISGFTIQKSEEPHGGGIAIKSSPSTGDYINISGNIIKNLSSNNHAIKYTPLYHNEKNIYNTITNNVFINNDFGIALADMQYTTIKDNIFLNHGICIYWYGQRYNCNNMEINGNYIDNYEYIGIEISGNNNEIIGNIITNNTFKQYNPKGMKIEGSNNKIINNNIFNCFGIGLQLSGSNNKIRKNNFFNNRINAICIASIRENLWKGNYWDDWIGFKYPLLNFLPYFNRYLFWFIIDWNPASEPYDI